MTKHVLSVSLGSPTRDKAVFLELAGVEIRAERRGVGGAGLKQTLERSVYGDLMFSLGLPVPGRLLDSTVVRSERISPRRSSRPLSDPTVC